MFETTIQVGLITSLKGKCDLGRLFRLTLSFFLGSVYNIIIAAYVYNNAFPSACHC